MEVAGPRSGFFHDDRAQTTFLSRVTSKIWTVPAHSSVLLFPAPQLELSALAFLTRVTSKIWTVPAHSSVLLFPAHQLETTVLPFASRIAVCVLNSLILGTSAWVSSQTASPFALTSRT